MMAKAIGIELKDSNFHEIIEPFLSLVPSYKEKLGSIYIFTSVDEANYIQDEIKEFEIIEAMHILYFLKKPTLYNDFDDYGFRAELGFYLLENLILNFSIIEGTPKDKEMALLQFDEHLIAKDQEKYYVALHDQELIENIANAYHITIRFFELDKWLKKD